VRTKDEYMSKNKAGNINKVKPGDIPASLHLHAGLKNDINGMSFYLNPVDCDSLEDWSIVSSVWMESGFSFSDQI
jgi:hypothetical protein